MYYIITRKLSDYSSFDLPLDLLPGTAFMIQEGQLVDWAAGTGQYPVGPLSLCPLLQLYSKAQLCHTQLSNPTSSSLYCWLSSLDSTLESADLTKRIKYMIVGAVIANNPATTTFWNTRSSSFHCCHHVKGWQLTYQQPWKNPASLDATSH